MYVNRTFDMYMQRQCTIRINAESREFLAQFRVDQSVLLDFKIVTFYSLEKITDSHFWIF